MATLIYVDESGDLGWSFESPYGRGGSSRYLTIAAMILPEMLDHLPERKVRQLYRQGNWDSKREKKWVEMPTHARMSFAHSALMLQKTYNQITYCAIVVDKRNVNENFRRDSNKLYNYMLKLLLLDEMTRHSQVTLIPDPRLVKVENGKSLHHYLEMMLYERQAATRLESIQRDSRGTLNLQFVDMLAGVVGNHFEFNKSEPWQVLAGQIRLKQLFFLLRQNLAHEYN